MKKVISLLLLAAMALALCACGGVDAKYEPLIEALDEHDYDTAHSIIYSLREEAIERGDIVVLEPQDEDYDLVNHYESIIWNIQRYTQNSSLHVSIPNSDAYLEDNDAMAYCYAQLKELGDVDKWLDSEYFDFEEDFPTDRQAVIDSFKIVKDVPTKVTRTTTDNMGNISTNDYITYSYNENGILTNTYYEWSAADLIWDGIFSISGCYHYTRNDAGQVTETKITDQAADSVYAVVTYAYDAKGNRISDTIRNNDGDHVFTYTYDTNNRMIQMDHDGEYNDYSVFYTYDATGNLIQKDVCTYYYPKEDVKFTNEQVTTVYTYDASGNPTGATRTTKYFGWNYDGGNYTPYVSHETIDSITYTVDSQGRILQETWQYGQRVYQDGRTGPPQYATQVLDYFYDDYYIYDPS